MPVTYKERKYGVEYRYQIIRPRDGNGEQKHIVFQTKDDWKIYHMAELGYLPPFNYEWRDGQEGEWVQGDGPEEIDKGIVEILFKKEDLPHPQDNRKDIGSRGGRKSKYAERGYCRTIVGSFICSPERRMTTDFNKISNRYRFDQKTKAHRFRDAVENEEITLLEKQWLIAVSASDFRLDTMTQIWMVLHADAQKKTFATEKFAKARINALLGKEFVMNTLLKQIQQKLSTIGVTSEEILERYNDLSLNARREDIKLSATDRLAALIGINDAIEQRKKNLLEGTAGGGGPKRLSSFGGTKEIDAGESNEVSDMLGTSTIEDAKFTEESTDKEEKKVEEHIDGMNKEIDGGLEIKFDPEYNPKQASLECELSQIGI